MSCDINILKTSEFRKYSGVQKDAMQVRILANYAHPTDTVQQLMNRVQSNMKGFSHDQQEVLQTQLLCEMKEIFT